MQAGFPGDPPAMPWQSSNAASGWPWESITGPTLADRHRICFKIGLTEPVFADESPRDFQVSDSCMRVDPCVLDAHQQFLQ